MINTILNGLILGVVLTSFVLLWLKIDEAEQSIKEMIRNLL